MRRRALLALLGSTLSAGCATPTRDAGQPTVSPAPVPEDTPTGRPSTPSGQRPTPDQSWSLVTFETLPVTVSLTQTRWRTGDGGEFTLEFARPAIPSHPATLRGTLRNATDFEKTFDLEGVPLFQNIPSARPRGRLRNGEYASRDELVLAPTAGHALSETVPEVTLADDGRWRLADEAAGRWFPETRRMAPGERMTLEYALVGRPEGDGFPRALYHFGGASDTQVGFSVWSTDRPGPSGSTFADVRTPALPHAETMAWYHSAGPKTASYLKPSRERASLPSKVDFTFVNHRHEVVTGNPYFWRLWKQVDVRWFHVAPWGWSLPLLMLPPGGTHDWTLAAFPDHAVTCDGAQTVGHLGGGRYAFEVGIGREGVTHAALLDFDAPATAIEPIDGLDARRNGDVVRARWPHREAEGPTAVLSLTRAAGAETQLVAEQVMQPRNAGLRNSIPFLETGVERVNLITDRNTVSRGARTDGYEDGSFRFEFRGTAYAATAEFDAE